MTASPSLKDVPKKNLLGHYGETLDTNAVLRILGIHRNTITNWVKAGKIRPALVIGSSYLFKWEDIKEIAEQRGVPFFEEMDGIGN